MFPALAGSRSWITDSGKKRISGYQGISEQDIRVSGDQGKRAI
ncbi:MAG: hypothetical protein WC628_06150 [Candidatus Omnitrophota bacterium]